MFDIPIERGYMTDVNETNFLTVLFDRMIRVELSLTVTANKREIVIQSFYNTNFSRTRVGASIDFICELARTSDLDYLNVN